MGLAIWISSDALSDISHVAATEPEASHIWLVPVVFAWLVWIGRDEISRFPSGSAWPGAISFVVGVLLWWWGYSLQVQSMWHLGGICIIGGAFLFFSGADYLWRFLPAWGATLFLIPVPGRVRFFIAQPLERLAAAVTQSIGEVLGLAVGRSGNQLSINGVDVCVAEACNGMRLIFTLLLVCYVAMFIRPYRPWLRIGVLCLSPLVALTVNIGRLVPTLWVYSHFSSRTAEIFHDVAGAVMVLLAFLILTTGCGILQWIGLPILQSTRPKMYRVSTMDLLPRSALVLVTLGICVGAVRRMMLPKPAEATTYLHRVETVANSIPLSNSEWVGTDIPLPQASLDELRPNVAISRRYVNRSSGQSVDLLILQSSDIRDLVPHYPPVCYPGQGLILVDSRAVSLQLARTNVVAKRYSFEWHDFRRGTPTVVDNFMVLPTGHTQPDTGGMERQIGTDHRYFGCAQVQVVYRDLMSPREQTLATESVLKPYLQLLTTIESGAVGR